MIILLNRWCRLYHAEETMNLAYINKFWTRHGFTKNVVVPVTLNTSDHYSNGDTCFQGDPGVPGFKGEAGPKGEPVGFQNIFSRNHL